MNKIIKPSICVFKLNITSGIFIIFSNNIMARIENKKQKEIAKKLYLGLKKWERDDGLSNPTGSARITDNYNVIPD